jgi:hypothetical protein
MKKNLPILVLLISIILFMIFMNKNEGVLDNNAPSLTRNDKKEIKLVSNKEILEIKIHDTNKASVHILPETTFDDLLQEEVRYIQRDCGEFLYTNSFIEEYIEDYKNKYLSTRNKNPSKQQINAVLKIVKKCNQYKRFQNDVENTIYDYDLSIEKDAFEIAKQRGDQEGNKFLESHLFDKDMSTRLSAAKLLRNKKWINSVNQSLEISQTVTIDDSVIVMPEAILIRECELGLFDCSMSSFAVLHECQISPLACGRDFRSILELSLTGYQLDLLEKYLTYLRSLAIY